jgi:type I restriction enzyme R subunit
VKKQELLQMIGAISEYGSLPKLERCGLRDCQYQAEIELEKSLKAGNNKNLAVLATGVGDIIMTSRAKAA